MLEGGVQKRVWFRLGRWATLFRLNTGKAWVGAGKPKRLNDGSVVLPFARPIALGFSLPNGDPLVGAADLNGWTSVIVTPEMVGKRIAIYTATENKKTEDYKVTDEQINYLTRVHTAGGISIVAASEDEAVELFTARLRDLGVNISDLKG